MGREVLRQLHSAGHEIRLLTRDRSSPATREIAARQPLDIREGNVLDASGLPRAMQGADAIIHLVGIISELGQQTFERVHTQATQNIVRAAVISGVRRVVHMSALGTRADAVSRYHQSKWAAEQVLCQSVLDWTIFRPSLIYGAQDQFVNFFARMASWSPILPVLANKRVAFQPVAVENVARCFVRALGEARSIRQIYDVCGPEQLTLVQILRAILKVTGRKCLLLHVPLELARPLAWFLEVVYPQLLKKAPPLSRDQLLMLQENNVGEGEWTADLFKLQQVNFAEGIAGFLSRAA